MWNDKSHLTVMVLNVYDRLYQEIEMFKLIPEIILTSVITSLLLKVHVFLNSNQLFCVESFMQKQFTEDSKYMSRQK